jgi:hypothetical protein
MFVMGRDQITCLNNRISAGRENPLDRRYVFGVDRQLAGIAHVMCLFGLADKLAVVFTQIDIRRINSLQAIGFGMNYQGAAAIEDLPAIRRSDRADVPGQVFCTKGQGSQPIAASGQRVQVDDATC